MFLFRFIDPAAPGWSRSQAEQVPTAKQYPAWLFHREPGSTLPCTKHAWIFIQCALGRAQLWISVALVESEQDHFSSPVVLKNTVVPRLSLSEPIP